VVYRVYGITNILLNGKLLKSLVLQKLKDIFIQHWHSEIERTSNTNLYKHFKTSFGISNYIDILDKSSCKRLIAFLTRNHRLPIEIGRWQNIPSHDRKCIFNCNDRGDEYHYLIKCHVLTMKDHNTSINNITNDLTCINFYNQNMFKQLEN